MRAALGDKNIDFVAVNDLTNAATLAHLLKYDSIHGNLPSSVEAKGDTISVDGDEFKVLSLRDPAQLPWKRSRRRCRCSRSTGLFTTRDGAAKHIEAGAKKVVITAPAKGQDVTIVLGGVNEETCVMPAKHHVISERLVHDELPRRRWPRVLHKQFGIRKGLDDDHPTPTRTTSSCSTCRTRIFAGRARRRCR